MMIVENKEESIELANKTAGLITTLINEELKSFKKQDPAEHIYLLVHIMSNLIARIVIGLDGYGKMYGIDDFNHDKIFEWINVMSREYIKENSKEI